MPVAPAAEEEAGAPEEAVGRDVRPPGPQHRQPQVRIAGGGDGREPVHEAVDREEGGGREGGGVGGRGEPRAGPERGGRRCGEGVRVVAADGAAAGPGDGTGDGRALAPAVPADAVGFGAGDDAAAQQM